MTDIQSAPPQIGKVVKAARGDLALTLDQLSQRSGISKSMLSQIERGQVNPTFSTVWNLVTALGLDISAIMGGREEARRNVVDHMPSYSTPVKTSADGMCMLRLLSPKRTLLPVEWYELVIQPGGELKSDADAMGTYEHLSCFAGRFLVKIADRNIVVEAGDTIRYYADQPHSIRNGRKRKSSGLLLIAHPAQYGGPHKGKKNPRTGHEPS